MMRAGYNAGPLIYYKERKLRFGVEGGTPVRRFIIFLIRRRLGVRAYERFQFVNQKSDTDYYWFTEIGVMKREFRPDKIIVTKPSTVSLNWLLDNDCAVISLSEKEEGE